MHCQNLLFDPARIPSPCFVLDEAQLLANAATLGACLLYTSDAADEL